MPDHLKVELGFALLALIQVITTLIATYVQERRANERFRQSTNDLVRAFVEVDTSIKSLRPAAETEESTPPYPSYVERAPCDHCGHAHAMHAASTLGGPLKCRRDRCVCADYVAP